jgi:hypothetical protein
MTNDYSNQNPLTHEEVELNKLLGLTPPKNALTESLPLWEGFFSLMRRAYLGGMLSKDNIFEHLRLFYNIADSKKPSVLVELDELYTAKENQIALVDELREQDRLNEKVDEAIENLSEEDRQMFLNVIANGGEEIEQIKIPGIDPEISEEIVLARLQNTFNRSGGGFRVDGGVSTKVNQNPLNAGVIASEDLEDRFDLENEKNDIQIQNNIPRPTPPPQFINTPKPINSNVSKFVRPVKNLNDLTDSNSKNN